MTVETKHHLEKETLKELQDLVRINVDSAEGYRCIARHVNDLSLSETFLRLANQRELQGEDLSRLVEWNGRETMVEGSVAAKLHRVWITIREKLSSDNAFAMLCEAERGEDYIKDAYEAALLRTAGSAVNDVLLHQLSIIRQDHDWIRTLRDEYEAR